MGHLFKPRRLTSIGLSACSLLSEVSHVKKMDQLQILYRGRIAQETSESTVEGLERPITSRPLGVTNSTLPSTSVGTKKGRRSGRERQPLGVLLTVIPSPQEQECSRKVLSQCEAPNEL